MTSYPKSKVIDKIEYSKIVYLTDTFSNTINSNDFNLETGRPLKNVSDNPNIDAFFLNVVRKSLFERKNINDQFIYDYPHVLETDNIRDLHITNETTISSVFIAEGASMHNMFGYYFYTVDENGNKQLLDNDRDVEDYYYKPTIIYPNVYSDENDSNSISKGNTRLLRGNLPNGNFQNIHIGFVLIPHGWYAYKNNTTVDDRRMIYSTIDFNTYYHETEYKMINDKIYSIYVKSESDQGHELLFVGFEDIFGRSSFDYDYNDCVIGFEISDVSNIVDYDKYAKLVLETEEINNNIVFISDNGEFVRFDDNIYNISPDSNHIFERHFIFNNISDRDEYYTTLIQLLGNFNYDIIKEDDINNNIYKIISYHLFRKNDISNSRKNGKKELFLFQIKFNKHLNDIVNTYKSLLAKHLTSDTYQEKYKLYNVNTLEGIIHLTDTIDLPKRISTDNFRIIGNGVMDCKRGKSHLPFNKSAIYQVYKNMELNGTNGLVINVKMDNHPTGYQLGNKNFVRYVSFVVDTNEHIIVDLGNLDLYQELNDTLTLNNDVIQLNTSFNNIEVSDIQSGSDTIKGLVAIFRNNSGAIFRTVTIKGGLKFYCIRFPNIKNNPTMIYLDSQMFINWFDDKNVTSGTYFNKRIFTEINSFVTI